MHLLAIIINEVPSQGERVPAFLILACVVILLSWGLIKISNWLGIVAYIFALLSAWFILHELWMTEVWLGRSGNEVLEPSFVRVAIASAALPILAITALLLVKKGRPNKTPRSTPPPLAGQEARQP